MKLPDKEIGCHRTGFKTKCHTLVTSGRCNRWIEVAGSNPNTGEDIKHYDCVDNWMPMLLIENSQQSRQTGAAVESLRNQIVEQQKIANVIEAAKLRQAQAYLESKK